MLVRGLVFALNLFDSAQLRRISGDAWTFVGLCQIGFRLLKDKAISASNHNLSHKRELITTNSLNHHVFIDHCITVALLIPVVEVLLILVLAVDCFWIGITHSAFL